MDAGYVLPSVPEPRADYLPAKTVGNFVYLSGQVPFVDNELQVQGRLGEGVSEEAGDRPGRVGRPERAGRSRRISARWMRSRSASMTVYVARAPTFHNHHTRGERREQSCRSAAMALTRVLLGVTSLPLNAVVEVQLVLGSAVSRLAWPSDDVGNATWESSQCAGMLKGDRACHRTTVNLTWEASTTDREIVGR